MHKKDIKRLVRKQLKKEYPNWKRHTNKEKKNIAQKILDEITDGYDFDQTVEAPMSELLGIENQIPGAGIFSIEKMKEFVENYHCNKLFRIQEKKHPAIKDEELCFIDNLIDDAIINSLLSYDGYTPAMREFLPSNLFRAELLKVIKYPEISYRKFCGDDKHYKGFKVNNDFTGMDQKQNRAFIGLPLNVEKMILHNQLSQFRSSLSFTQLTNLMVYILYHFKEAGYLGEDDIHCIDSTELALDNQKLLATIKIKGKKVRIYDDIDSDCGKRRNKRDKSVYVVGYRMHTLTAINAKTGQSYPLISLLAPANHHDSNFLGPLVRLGQAIGLELKFITADEAYVDKDCEIYKETGVNLIKPPGAKARIPENVETSPMFVKMDDRCEIPMEYAGIEDNCHEFKCSAQFGECPYAGSCPKYRHIPIDTGHFQRIICDSKEVQKALDIRKNGERPFNLIKKREGLDQVRVRSQPAVLSRSVFSTIVTLLIEMAGTRKTEKKKERLQKELPFEFKKASGF